MPLDYFILVGSLITRNIHLKKFSVYEKYNLNGKAVNIVKSFHLKFKAKKLTKNGKECKESLTSKGFYNKS